MPELKFVVDDDGKPYYEVHGMSSVPIRGSARPPDPKDVCLMPWAEDNYRLLYFGMANDKWIAEFDSLTQAENWLEEYERVMKGVSE